MDGTTRRLNQQRHSQRQGITSLSAQEMEREHWSALRQPVRSVRVAVYSRTVRRRYAVFIQPERMVDGTKREGVSVTPDIIAEVDIGRDNPLAAALTPLRCER